MRPDDIALSDVGRWESTGDGVADVQCAGCRRRGTSSMLVSLEHRLCWSCWARRPITTTPAAPAAASPRVEDAGQTRGS